MTARRRAPERHRAEVEPTRRGHPSIHCCMQLIEETETRFLFRELKGYPDHIYEQHKTMVMLSAPDPVNTE